MNVSVVVPAHNAAKTLGATLQSLLDQTVSGWEVIVVDDGSQDDTAKIAAAFAHQDSRIRVVSQPQGGVCAARNAGIEQAQFEWLLFLDADDWLAPVYLERMTHLLVANPHLDAVYCGWVRVTPDGTCLEKKLWHQSGDLFDALARFCPFAIHACVVRRSIVQTVGAFDQSLRTCEEWDLWQRIARTDAQFGQVSEGLAFYRMSQNSLSADAVQLFKDGLRVITQGHTSDSRVAAPRRQVANGIAAEHLSESKLRWVSWCAALMLGSGQDPEPLLNELTQECAPELDPFIVAVSLFEAAILPICQSPSAWYTLWTSLEQPIHAFLLALEAQAQAPRLVYRTLRKLESLILEHAIDRPLTLGNTHAICVEITEPIKAVTAPPLADRLQCAVELEGERLGILELPIFDGFILGSVLADAIASRFAWMILKRFFERNIYPNLIIKRTKKGLSIWRNNLCLADGLPDTTSQPLPSSLSQEPTCWATAHDQIGWTIFLQELWGHPDWKEAYFYQPPGRRMVFQQLKKTGFKTLGAKGSLQAFIQELMPKQQTQNGFTVEISQPLPNLLCSTHSLTVIPKLAGSDLGAIPVNIKESIKQHPRERRSRSQHLSAQALSAAITKACGFELVVVAIREGVIGQPLAGSSLRERLAAATLSKRSVSDFTNLSPDRCNLFLTRSVPDAIGTSVSRRAMLPIAAAPDLTDLIASSPAHQSLVHPPEANGKPAHVVYTPELINAPIELAATSQDPLSQQNLIRQAKVYGREHFETLFATQPDPWKYTHPYEQIKYSQTLELLPDIPIQRALELACAEGHFTEQLAAKVEELIAADISQIALDRTSARCADSSHIHYRLLDLARDPLPTGLDLIVCSEVLYYIGGVDQLRVFAEKVAAALNPGGYFLTAHANLVVDAPDQPGYNWDHAFGAKVIGETFASLPTLQWLKELRTPLYRIQLFQRTASDEAESKASLSTESSEIIELAQPTPPPPQVANMVLWQGGMPQQWDVPSTVTYQLPILMYHRVAATGAAVMERYRVTPAAFAAQLQYLHDAGFYTVTLAEWHSAMTKKMPLPGRAIMLTFDDGYQDFLTEAFPLLNQYGFSATVFIVTERAGRINDWDALYGEALPLLSWDEIRQLQAAGIEFGSHSVSHQPLTGLSSTEMVQEGLRSRSTLQQELGRSIVSCAYPYGNTDAVVQHVMGSCGYQFGLSCKPGFSKFDDDLLNLPRIEVYGSDSLTQFVAKLKPGHSRLEQQ